MSTAENMDVQQAEQAALVASSQAHVPEVNVPKASGVHIDVPDAKAELEVNAATDVVQLLDSSGDSDLRRVASIIRWLQDFEEPSDAQIAITQRMYEELKRLVILIHRSSYDDLEPPDVYELWDSYDYGLQVAGEAQKLCVVNNNEDEEEAVLKQLYEEEDFADVDWYDNMSEYDDMSAVVKVVGNDFDRHPYMVPAKAVITQLLTLKKPLLSQTTNRMYDALHDLVFRCARLDGMPFDVIIGAEAALKEAQRCDKRPARHLYDYLTVVDVKE